MINLEWSFLFPLAFLSSKDNLLKEKMPYLFSMAKVINILLSPQNNINKEPRQRLLCFQFLILPLLLTAHTCFTQLSEREGGEGKNNECWHSNEWSAKCGDPLTKNFFFKLIFVIIFQLCQGEQIKEEIGFPFTASKFLPDFLGQVNQKADFFFLFIIIIRELLLLCSPLCYFDQWLCDVLHF